MSEGSNEAHAHRSDGAEGPLTFSRTSPPVAPGTQIGPYKLHSVLGEGGFGIVYLAEQKKPVRRQVALKVIKPGMDSKQVLARFEAEEQALALLDHPHIAHVLEAGTTEGGRPYFVMEYVKGLPITEYCDQERLTIDERLRLFLQVCEGVQHAHQKGIIHRDIKPSNILVCEQGGKAVPKIIDFGVAKALSQPLTERTLYTEQGQLIGTPEYMSPEQAEVGVHDIDTRSDIYSLGVVLYQLLAGVLPFDPQTLRQAAFSEVQRVIREEDPPLPSTRVWNLGEKATGVAQNRRTDTKRLVHRLHHELEWIPLKAMRKERERRYKTVSDLVEDVQNYLRGIPLLAGPESTWYRLRKSVHRNKALVAGVAAVLFVLAAGVVVSTGFATGQARARAEADKLRRAEAAQRLSAEAERDKARQAEQAAEQRRTEAVEAQREAERQAGISRAVIEFLNNDLLSAAIPAKAMGRAITVREALDIAARQVPQRFEKERAVKAAIHQTIGRAFRLLGEYKRAEPHLEQALLLRKAEFSATHHDTLVSINDLASLYGSLGRLSEAEKLASELYETARRVLGEEHASTLVYANNLGSIYDKERRYEESERLYLRVLEVKRRVRGEESPGTLVTMANLAGVYRAQNRLPEAEELCTRVLKIQQRVLGKDNPTVLATLSMLAAIYRQQGRLSETEQLYREIIGVRRQVLGEKHPETLITTMNLGLLCQEQKRYAEAERWLVAVYEGYRQVLGRAHPRTVGSLQRLVRLSEEWGRPEKAEQWRAELSQADLPQPADGSRVGGLAGLTLKWAPRTRAVDQRILFGSDANNLAVLGSVGRGSQFEAPVVEPEKTYFWRVDAVASDGSVEQGRTWSFSTGRLVGWWQFDEGKGQQAADSSGAGHHGRLTGALTWVPGIRGTALSFDGTDDVVDVNATALQLNIAGNAPRTVTVWVLPRSFGNTGIFEMGSYWKYGCDFALKTWTGDNWYRLQYWGDDLDHDFFVASKNVWTHLALAHDGDQTKLYANGRLLTSLDRNIATGNDRPLAFGRWWTKYFQGCLDDFRLYDCALTEEEIQAIYQAREGLPTGAPNPATGTPVTSDRARAGTAIDEDGSANAVRSLHTLLSIDPCDLSSLNDLAWLQATCPNATVRDGSQAVRSATAACALTQWRDAGLLDTLAAAYAEAGQFDKAVQWQTAALQHLPENSRADTRAELRARLALYEQGRPYHRAYLWPRQLIAHYTFDTIQGDAVFDSSSHGIHGKLIGDAQIVADAIRGKVLRLDGTGDWVDCGNDRRFDLSEEITVAAWVKVDTWDHPWQAIVTKGEYAWRLQRAEYLDFPAFHCSGLTCLSKNQWDQGPEGTVNVNDGQWHHVVGTYVGNKISLYMDGALDTAEDTTGRIRVSAEPVYIGANPTMAGRAWHGLIDDVRIYSYALSESDVKALYRETSPGTP